jgi:hypothetical protein
VKARTGLRVSSIVATASQDDGRHPVRLEPNSTNNDEGRTFPFASLAPLRRLLERQRLHTREAELRTDARVPSVFHRKAKPIKDYRHASRRPGTGHDMAA